MGGVSDHARFWVQIRAPPPRNRRPFQFFNHLASHPQFLEILNEVWLTTQPLFHSRLALNLFHKKLKLLKEPLRRLNREKYGNIPSKVKEAYDDLCCKQNAAHLNPQASTFADVTESSEKWNHLASIEEQFYHQKSRVQWMQFGDHNTRFFHRVAEDEEAGRLVQPIQLEEIKRTLFSMPLNKAPGPDGYTVEFFKAAWPVIGQDFVVAVQSFFLYGFMPKGINGTILTLVPKVTNPETMKDFRPIACCNLVYKVISKILAQRLKRNLPEAIELNQSAFVKGRLLLENVLLATELVKDYHKAAISSRSALKLDISMAFDTVQWPFIIATLKAMHYPDQFIFWISQCISTASFSISVNGELEGFFQSSRGLRQGCSLSPYLYVNTSNVLSGLLSKAAREKGIGIHPKCKALNMSHLSFADDIMVFTDGSPQSLHGTLAVFEEFAHMSGLTINVTKSSLFAASRGKQQLENEAMNVGLAVCELPVRYLGLPLTTKAMTKTDYEPLLEKIRKRLSHWTTRHPSYAGRVQLIKSVIASITNFWSSVFCLPKRCFKEIEGMCSAFLWSGSPNNHSKSKVAWEDLCVPKQEGGLGIRRLHEVARVFALSLIWKIISDSNSLWVAWVRQYLIRRGTFWDVKETALGSWQWRKLLKLCPLAVEFVRHEVRNGRNTFFWFDKWLPMGRLIDQVGETGICSLGVQRYAKVADTIIGATWGLRRCRDRKLNDIKQYICGLNVPDSEAGKDMVLWRHTADEYRSYFSSSRTWDQLRTRSDAKPWSKIIWFPQAVPRFAFISWLAIKDRLSTGERTSHWGHDQPCLFCGEPVESRDHLYFACPYSFTVWLEVVGSLIPAPDPDWSETLRCLSMNSCDGNTRILLRLAFQATLYYLWRERNERKHNQRYRSNIQPAAAIEKAIKARIMSLRCSLAQKEFLDKQFTNEEIRDAFFSLLKNKTSGPDGYSTEFFKGCRPIIGPEISAAVAEFFKFDFRPNSCLNSVYKVSYLEILAAAPRNQVQQLPPSPSSEHSNLMCDNLDERHRFGDLLQNIRFKWARSSRRSREPLVMMATLNSCPCLPLISTHYDATPQNKSLHSYGDDEESPVQSSEASVSRPEDDEADDDDIIEIPAPAENLASSSAAVTRKGRRSRERVRDHTTTTTKSADLVNLCQLCHFPPEVTMMVPPRGQNPENVPAGWCCTYVNFFEKCGLFFPIPTCVLETLRHLRLAFPQMTTNFVRHILALFTRAREEGRDFNHHQLLRLCYIKTNNRANIGTYYLSGKPGCVVLEGTKSCRDTNWRAKYFFFRVDRHSVGDYDFYRIATTWASSLVRARDTSESTGDEFALAALLRRERNTWATFSRERIRSALGVASAIDAVPLSAIPAIQHVPIPQDPPQEPIFEDPALQASPSQVRESPAQASASRERSPLDSSSTSHQPLIMRRPSLRAQRAAAGGSTDRACTGDLPAIVDGARNALAAPHASTSSAQASGVQGATEATAAAAVSVPQENINQEVEDRRSNDGVVNDDIPSSPKRARGIPGASSVEAPPDAAPLAPDQQVAQVTSSNERRSDDRSLNGERAPRGRGRSGSRGGAHPQEVRQPANSRGGSGGSTASRPFHWSYNHNRDYPIVEDESGVAHLLRRIKGHGCQIPAVRNLTEAEAFIEMMTKNAQALAAQNKVVALFEQRLSTVPLVAELEEARKLVTELIAAVKAGGDQQVEGGTILSKGPGEKSVEGRHQVRSQEVKAAVREAKAGLVSAYAKALSGIKEKWVAKKDHSLYEGHAAEVESNLMLIDQIQKETVDLEVEKPRLAAQLVELNAKCTETVVSDFSVSKLDLPQISETSEVQAMDVDENGTLIGLNEFGSNREEIRRNLQDENDLLFGIPSEKFNY
ncbi:hypothetical protein ISN45_Aa08g009650 [Arabidopsis thaliana x Arabidopsis arenosa]|uniref:Reverse transcriptase domain-containing protein n=1 Tax=Arabidopsis thaliana x Arabidopsis arenosa TaxID=1240361 RepID=A0A8T1XFK8_9BRAS|nr:hypothetical protein ISN45_Aa08g009650 [Arabidopsis thaliana x Arabidopsis arenosa]